MTTSNPQSAVSGERPPISVVVVLLGGRPEYLDRCLGGLDGQLGGRPPEVIVPLDDRHRWVDAARDRYPWVRFLRLEGRKTYAEMRAAGCREAQGHIVAITEDHCIPQPGWCSNLIRLHGDGHAAVGGAVDKSGPDRALNWAIYLCDFGRYMNPVAEGPSDYLTDVNVSYKRQWLEDLTALWTNEFHETTINWTLLERGQTLWLSPTVVVRQRRELRFGPAMRERYAFGRLFASTRVAAVSRAKGLVYAALSILLPIVLTMRVVRTLAVKRRNLSHGAAAFPLVVLLNFVWSFGECLGYLTGAPSSGLSASASDQAEPA